ncbi:putative RGS domain superfamily protein [Helianthus anomalus]
MSLNKKESFNLKTMGEALGIPDSGSLSQNDATLDVDPNDPLDKLLQNKRFLLSFMEFADRSCLHLNCINSQKTCVEAVGCLAGESVHFYSEVQQLEKIPVTDPVKRIYMVRHIIEKYISAGITLNSPVESN